MNIEPTGPYVYQPEPVNSPIAPRLWGVAGPGTEPFYSMRLEKEHAKALVKLIRAVRAYRDENNARQYEDLVSSNIDTIRGIHEESLRLIKQIAEESLSAHPHYEDSYPSILKMVKDNRASQVKP